MGLQKAAEPICCPILKGRTLTNAFLSLFQTLHYRTLQTNFTNLQHCEAEMWIRIRHLTWIRIRILIRIQGIDDRKSKKKNIDEKFVWSKIAIYLCPRYRRRLQTSRENIQHFKKWSLITFFRFSMSVGHICPPGSRAPLNPDRYGSGSGSTHSTAAKQTLPDWKPSWCWAGRPVPAGGRGGPPCSPCAGTWWDCSDRAGSAASAASVSSPLSLLAPELVWNNLKITK